MICGKLVSARLESARSGRGWVPQPSNVAVHGGSFPAGWPEFCRAAKSRRAAAFLYWIPCHYHGPQGEKCAIYLQMGRDAIVVSEFEIRVTTCEMDDKHSGGSSTMAEATQDAFGAFGGTGFDAVRVQCA